MNRWRSNGTRPDASSHLASVDEFAIRLVKFQGEFERWHAQRTLRYIVAAIIVSVSVQIGMLPLLVLYFHRISIAGLALNIVVGALMALMRSVRLRPEIAWQQPM